MRDLGFLTTRLLLLGGMALATTGAEAKVSVKRQGATTTMKFDVEGVAFQKAAVGGQTFETARLKGVQGYEGIHYRKGEPELPVVRFYADGDVVVTKHGELEAGTLGGKAKIKPSQPSRVKIANAPEPALALNEAVYKSKEYGPKAAYTIEDAGSVNGVKRKLVTLYPFAYAPADGKWSLTRSFTVQVKHAAPKGEDAAGREIFALVVGEKFKDSPSLAQYAQLKEDLGFLVETIVVAAGDTPDTIRGKLKELYKRTDATLKYALLVGEDDDVPGKESDIIAGVTDHYYRAIDTDDYAADINGPDIGVGRVSVEDEAQLAVVLGKFKRYVDGQFSESDWLNEIAWLATDDRYEVAEASHNYVIDTYTSPKGYKGVFPDPNQAGGDKLYAITHRVTDAKVVEVMGLGRTIINYSGHGSNTSWAGPNVTQDDVRGLSDRNALPFVISNACITGDYRVGEAFAETWQRHDAGAIMFWGSMDSTYWDEDDILEKRMYDGIFVNGNRTFAKITDFALGEHYKHFGGEGYAKYYWETYVLFGDPSLEFRGKAPRAVSVAGPAALPVGVSQVSYTVTDAKGPVAGARVALGVPGRTLRLAGTTDADGKVAFDLSNASRDVATLVVTVSGADAALARQELKIVPADTPYLSFSEFKVNGRTELGVSLGENAVLNFHVQNLGERPTRGGKIEVTKVEGPARFAGQSLRVPALAARAAYRVDAEDLKLVVDADAANGAVVKVELTWTTDEGQTAVVPLSLRVKRAALAVTKVDFGDTNADGSAGGIHPGETGNVYVTVTNTGSEWVRDAVLAPQAGACVSEVRGQLVVEGLAPGASVRLDQSLAVTVDAACKNGNDAALTLAGDYASAAVRVSLSAPMKFVAGVLSVQAKELADLSVAIPDDGEVEQAIEVASAGVLAAVGLHVKLEHSYIGDLTIVLIHPDGTEVVVHDRAGGSTADLDQVFGYEGAAVPGLAALAGKPAAGTWKLKVKDEAAQDTGTLKYVKLTLRGYLE